MFADAADHSPIEPRARRVDLLEERATHSIIQSFYDVYNQYGFGLTKAREKLSAMSQPQLLNYLKATRLELGLLSHFGPTPAFHRTIASRRR